MDVRGRSAVLGSALLAATAGRGAVAQPAAVPSRPAATVEAPSGLPPGAPRSAGPLSVVVLLSNAPDPTNPNLRRVTFREEATDPGFFAQFGGGSTTGEILVDCDVRQFQLGSFAMFGRNNLAGEAVMRRGPRAGWTSPRADTVIGRTIELACGSRRMVAAPAPPRPAPQPAPEPAPPVAEPRPSPPPRPAGAWRGAAQIAAAESEAQARAELARVARLVPEAMAGAATTVARAVVGGRTYHRALVGGFDSRAEATAFCRALEARGHACFVRE